MSDRQSFVVVGGGFAGMVAAYLLAKKGCTVTIVSRAHLGGVAGGITWHGFSLDLGCHIFGNVDDRSTEVLTDLLRGKFHPVDIAFASRFEGETLEGFELPDLAARADPGRMILEMAQAATKTHLVAENLEELLVQRFGRTAASALDSAFQKKYRIPSVKAAPEAIRAICFRRVRVVEDRIARILKQAPELDRVIAVGSEKDPMEFYRETVTAAYRAFYPSSEGMLGFVKSAQSVLESLGVSFLLGEGITSVDFENQALVTTASHTVRADHCVWTAGSEPLERLLLGSEELAGTRYGVPMALYYFDIHENQAGPYSYVNSFDSNDLVFRACVPSNYGNSTNAPSRRGYLCCEVPLGRHSEEFVHPDDYVGQVWQEACDFGAVSGRRGRYQVLTTPNSYRIPLAHFARSAAPLRERIQQLDRLTVSDEWAFSKNKIILDLDARIDALVPTRRVA